MRIALVVAGLVVALALPRVIYSVLALDILLWALFAMSVDLLVGYVGLLSFGHAAFWGGAAYVASLLARDLRLAFPLAALAGVTAAMALAVPVGYLSIRRRGIYFAMVTLAFAQMLFYLVNELRGVTGGENGVQGVPRLLWGVSVSRPGDFYYAALPLVLFGYFAVFRITRSPFGHVLAAIRDNEARAQALGYPTPRYKLLAFVLSAGVAGLAGSLYAIGHGFASLDLLHWTTSGTVVLMVVLGGTGTLWGSLLGAAIVLFLRDQLSSVTEASDAVTGAILIAIVLGFRRGLWRSLAVLPARAVRRLART
ncbi:MAG: branched-chain amino acid ABC transporter permease [Chloroflexi bacterium 13_1_40CM_68_21]|nr:MAG: branched-chain amino acid ABC transporter permease [Chloroflexi bacterium 13_1_40CM_68_21]